MNKAETLQILAIIKVAYPNSFNKFTNQDIKMLAKLWEIQFKDYDYKLVMNAVNTIISTDLNDFMPTIARIKEVCRSLSNLNQMSEVEAWQHIKKALSNSIYHAKEEYDKLPAICQKMVGSPSQLSQWATLDCGEVDTVIHSNFLKGFRGVIEHERQQDLIPLSIKQELMIEGGTNVKQR